MKQHFIKKALLITLTVLIVLGCNKQKSQLVNIGTPKTLSSIIIKESLSETTGYSVSYYDEHNLAMAELISGKKDLIVSGFSQGLNRYLDSKDIIMIAVTGWGNSTILVKDKQIASITDLQYKKISAPFVKSPIDTTIRAVFNNLNIETEIIYAPFNQQIAFLSTDRTAAIVIPEPLATMLIATNGFRKLTSLHDLWKDTFQYDMRTPQIALFAMKQRIPELKTKLDQAKKLIPENQTIINNHILISGNIYSEKYSVELGFKAEYITDGYANTINMILDKQTELFLIKKYLEIIGTDLEDKELAGFIY